MMAIRYGRWTVAFMIQEHESLDVWKKEFTKLRAPNIYDMLGDPFERGDTSMYYNTWFIEHVPMHYAATALVAQWLQSFKEFPVRQKPASFNLDEVMRKQVRGAQRRWQTPWAAGTGHDDPREPDLCPNCARSIGRDASRRVPRADRTGGIPERGAPADGARR
jgi:hypothetical protein